MSVTFRESIPASWIPVLESAVDDPSFAELERFVDRERTEAEVFPRADLVFEALRLTPFESVRAVILGQDPYHQPGLAQGLAFSVPDGAPQPGSLKSILAELETDLGVPVPRGRSLEPWARHGVLLLNSVLTVRRAAPKSHSGHGWEPFTDAIVRAVAARDQSIAFVFWGQDARAKASLVDEDRHPILMAAHPSPLSVWRGFRGSRPFSRVNTALALRGAPPDRLESRVTLSPTGVPFETEAQRAAHERLRGPLRDAFPGVVEERIHAIGYVLRFDDAVVTCTLTPWGDDDATIAVRTYLAGAVQVNAAALRELARWTSDLRFGMFGMDGDDNVYVEQQYVASSTPIDMLARGIGEIRQLGIGRTPGFRAAFGGSDL